MYHRRRYSSGYHRGKPQLSEGLFYFTQTSDNEWRSGSVQRHVKDASALGYARNIELIVCTGKHQGIFGMGATRIPRRMGICNLCERPEQAGNGSVRHIALAFR